MILHFTQGSRLSKKLAVPAILACAISIGASPRAIAQGATSSFAILSSSDVSMKNRVNINQVSVSGAACPGSVGCPGDVGGTTVLMGRGNAAAPDTISGDEIASATALQGLNCSNNPPGTTAICLGNDSEIAGACVTGGGAISSPTECATGTDTTSENPEVTTLLPQAQSAMASYSATLAALPATQTLSALVVGTNGSATISSSGGLNVVSLPSITAGTNSTLTLNGAATDLFVINIGNSTTPGSLQVGNGASVVLTGGITPDRVIFNLVGAGTAVQLGNHTVFNGTILGAQGQFTSGDGDTPNPILINGALLFGESISIGNNTNVNFYPFAGTGGNGNGSGSGSGSGSGTGT
jgi:hypothetical protein